MNRTEATLLTSASLVCLAAAVLIAQGPRTSAAATTSGGEVLGLGSYSPIVDNLDRSLEFYHDALGLDIPPQTKPGPRPYTLNRGLLNMLGTPDGKERHVAA